MATVGLVLMSWVALSFPLGVCVGRMLRTRTLPS